VASELSALFLPVTPPPRLLVEKTVITTVVVANEQTLSSLGTWLFHPVAQYPDVELTLVMVVCPFLLNGAQFWVMDNM
jgi:STIMATE family